jgi:hypothetical protein
MVNNHNLTKLNTIKNTGVENQCFVLVFEKKSVGFYVKLLFFVMQLHQHIAIIIT